MIHDDNQQLDYYTLRAIIESEVRGNPAYTIF